MSFVNRKKAGSKRHVVFRSSADKYPCAGIAFDHDYFRTTLCASHYKLNSTTSSFFMLITKRSFRLFSVMVFFFKRRHCHIFSIQFSVANPLSLICSIILSLYLCLYPFCSVGSISIWGYACSLKSAPMQTPWKLCSTLCRILRMRFNQFAPLQNSAKHVSGSCVDKIRP